MSQVPNDAELTSVESALGGLIPISSELDRDLLMFQAGALSRMRSRRTAWVWPSVAALLSFVVACETDIPGFTSRAEGRRADRCGARTG